MFTDIEVTWFDYVFLLCAVIFGCYRVWEEW